MALHMLFDYTAEDGTSLSAGDVVTVVQADGDGWALVQTAHEVMLWAPFDFVSKPTAAAAAEPTQGEYAHLSLTANPDYRAPDNHAPNEVEYSVLQVSARERLGTVLAMKKHVDALPDNTLSMMQEEAEDPLYDEVASVPPSNQRQASVYETIRPSFMQPAVKAPPVASTAAPLASLPNSVEDWLTSIGLPQYLDVLSSTPGFETLQGCATIDDDVALNEFCMSDSRDVTAMCIAARQLQAALKATTPPAPAAAKIALVPAASQHRSKAAPPPPTRRTPAIYGTVDEVAPASAPGSTNTRIVYTSVDVPGGDASGGDAGGEIAAKKVTDAQYTHVEIKPKQQPSPTPVVINIPGPPPPPSDDAGRYATPADTIAPHTGYKAADAVEVEAFYNVVDNTPDVPATTPSAAPGTIVAQPLYVNDTPVEPDPDAPPLPASRPPVPPQEAKPTPPPPPSAPPMALSGIISNVDENFYDTTDGDNSYGGDAYDLYDSVDPPDNVVTVDAVYSNVPNRHLSAVERTRAYIKAHPMLAATPLEDDENADWDDDQGEDADAPPLPASRGNTVPPLPPAATTKPALKSSVSPAHASPPGPARGGAADVSAIQRGGSARASLAELKSKGAVKAQRARVKDNIESMLGGAAIIKAPSPSPSTSSTSAPNTATTAPKTKKKPPPVKPRAKKGGKAVKSIQIVKLEQQLLVEKRVLDGIVYGARCPSDFLMVVASMWVCRLCNFRSLVL
eukprot:m.135504 g.135504  ORF g.135504 m.135504 type:complete len:735 (-) comp17555_c0_seq63:5460-7664(-)